MKSRRHLHWKLVSCRQNLLMPSQSCWQMLDRLHRNPRQLSAPANKGRVALRVGSRSMGYCGSWLYTLLVKGRRMFAATRHLMRMVRA